MPWLKSTTAKQRRDIRKRALKAKAPKHRGKWHPLGGDLEARLEDLYVVVRGKRAKREKCFFSEGSVDVMREMFRNQRRIENLKTYKSLRSKARRMRRSPPRPFSVLVDYKGGPDTEFERQMERVSRGKRAGSGYCFIDGTRDVEYTFTRRSAALAAAKRLKKLRRGLKVQVTGRVWP